MSASPEIAAAMTSPAQQHRPAGTVSEPPTSSPAAGPDASSSAAGKDMSGAAGVRAAQRRELSAGAAFALFGGLMTTMLGILAGLMMWQFDSLGDRIDTQSDRINTLGTELRSEMNTLETKLRGETAALGTDLRGEMQAGFREVNATLLDHTGRLARLEASVDAEP